MVSVKVFTPKPIMPKPLDRAIRGEKRKKGKDIVKELKKTVETWSGEKPSFKFKVKDRGNDVVIEITLVGTERAIEKWVMLNYGTREHVIDAKNPTGRLRFRRTDTGSGYEPKTTPGQLMSKAGSESQGEWHRPRSVLHPGVKAREWTKIIREMMEKEFGKRVQIVVKKEIAKQQK